MVRILAREIVILVLCLLIFPAGFILLMMKSGYGSQTYSYLSSRFMTEGLGLSGFSVSMIIRILSPYLFFQTIRAFLWSRRSLSGRKWTSLYFSLLLTTVAGWNLSESVDLFYFMYRLGDIPAELEQFIKLEAGNLIISLTCLIFAIENIRKFIRLSGSSSS
jgi:hypothetical protein